MKDSCGDDKHNAFEKVGRGALTRSKTRDINKMRTTDLAKAVALASSLEATDLDSSAILDFLDLTVFGELIVVRRLN